MDMEEQSPEIEQLYRDQRSALVSFFRRRHPAAHGLDDLLHETFLRLLKHKERLPGARSHRAYLFGIARHVSADAYRQAAAPAADVADLAGLAAPAPDPRLAAVREILSGLPPLQREILDLRFQHDLSYHEISTVLDVPVGTVRSRLHNALRLLRAQWGPGAAEPERS